MAYTFKKAQGFKICNSLCEDEQDAYCKEMLEAAAAKGIKILLPVDSVIANKFPETKDASDIEIKTVEGDIPDGWEEKVAISKKDGVAAFGDRVASIFPVPTVERLTKEKL